MEITDFSYKVGGGSTWKYDLTDSSSEANLINLAHNAYALLQNGTSTEDSIAKDAKAMLSLQYYGAAEQDNTTTLPKSIEMHGRKFADAAL